MDERLNFLCGVTNRISELILNKKKGNKQVFVKEIFDETEKVYNNFRTVLQQAYSAIETGELREDCGASPAVILCRPEGETLWNIAKRCGSTVSAIRNSNGLQEEPVDNRMLLIPVY